MTPIQRAAVARRYHAAEILELARQVARENSRYGHLTGTDQHTVHAAEVAYDEATRAARAVIA